MPVPLHIAAHKHSIRHRPAIVDSAACGCFHCLARFPPSEIGAWVDGGQTALCPRCGIDSVLGDQSGFPLDEAFLMQMRDHWFRESDEPPPR